MSTVFISYRRSDTSSGYASWIYERLAAKLGAANVFMDIDSLPLGVDFVEYLEKTLAQTDIALVLIGPAWLDASDEDGTRRIDNPDDFVRLEVELALRAARVIPVLLDDAKMPRTAQLPEPLWPLVRRNALVFHRRGGQAMQDLLEVVRKPLTASGESSLPTARDGVGQTHDSRPRADQADGGTQRPGSRSTENAGSSPLSDLVEADVGSVPGGAVKPSDLDEQSGEPPSSTADRSHQGQPSAAEPADRARAGIVHATRSANPGAHPADRQPVTDPSITGDASASRSRSPGGTHAVTPATSPLSHTGLGAISHRATELETQLQSLEANLSQVIADRANVRQDLRMLDSTQGLTSSDKQIATQIADAQTARVALERDLATLDSRDEELELAFQALRRQLRRFFRRLDAAERAIATGDTSVTHALPDEFSRQLAGFEKRLAGAADLAEEQGRASEQMKQQYRDLKGSTTYLSALVQEIATRRARASARRKSA